MAQFIVHDNEGNIINVGHCPEGEEQNQVFDDAHQIIVGVHAQAHHKIDMATKTVIECDLPPLPTPPSRSGTFDMAQMKALIYQVLMEIKDAQV